jgi:hypothetical protein
LTIPANSPLVKCPKCGKYSQDFTADYSHIPQDNYDLEKKTIKNALCAGRSLTIMLTDLSTTKKKMFGYTETTQLKKQNKHSKGHSPTWNGHGLNIDFMKQTQTKKTKKRYKVIISNPCECYIEAESPEQAEKKAIRECADYLYTRYIPAAKIEVVELEGEEGSQYFRK